MFGARTKLCGCRKFGCEMETLLPFHKEHRKVVTMTQTPSEGLLGVASG